MKDYLCDHIPLIKEPVNQNYGQDIFHYGVYMDNIEFLSHLKGCSHFSAATGTNCSDYMIRSLYNELILSTVMLISSIVFEFS